MIVTWVITNWVKSISKFRIAQEKEGKYREVQEEQGSIECNGPYCQNISVSGGGCVTEVTGSN